MRIQEEKTELQKKVRRSICVRDITFLATRPPFYVIFCCFFRLLRFYVKNKILFQKTRAPCLPQCLRPWKHLGVFS